MRNCFKEINATSHIKTEKPKPEPKAKRWELSCIKIDFETEFFARAAKKKILEANDKRYIVVRPYIEIQKMRRELQKFVNETPPIIKTGGIVLYMHHDASKLDDSPYAEIKEKVQRTASHYAYLITIPEGVFGFDFAIWVNNLIWNSQNAQSKK